MKSSCLASGFLLLALFSTTSFAVKQEPAGRMLRPKFHSAPDCQDRPEFLTEMRNDFLGGLSRLPETVLVAREVEFYVEGNENGGPVKLHGYQSFLRTNVGSSEVLCANAAPDLKERFSLYAPTLIDTRKQPKVGQSLWQFQMMTEGNKYSFWNFKTPSFQQNEALEAYLKSTGATYKIYQKTHTEFELLLVKQTEGVTQYLSITYDAVPHLK
ncbi:hypothetical protein [Bdellovibrio svalbardensis]|uniref:Secreted protein n=1 Tax=Bdellovibrio svalbardensis TaxID=2972972 RepID=A0ABT6DJJ1_9BACT|nr:hypothetical protein [Bdellovibrio svalbardensis]MDG0815253.1 hypothetical protein [Bdellovibrio svalbardensis]